MMSNVPVVGVIPPLQNNDQAKENILSSIQTAVKQVQSYYSICNTDDGFSIHARELYLLCDSLDKTLFYGLKECQQGYWPFVKHFTHRNTVKFIESLSNTSTQIQCGRAWLCLALNENTLESYFQSFQENLSLVKQHYFSLAILRDPQRMQLLLMLIAGLENVPISIDIDKVPVGTGLSFFSSYLCTDQNSSCSNSSFSQCDDRGGSSESGSQESDACMIECEDSDEVGEKSFTTTSISSPDEDCIANDDIYCNLSSKEIERITKYINMTPQNGLAHNTDLEVIRTKVVRRLKKSPVHSSNIQAECDIQSDSTDKVFSNDSDTSDTKENRLSKATTDSGVCLESHSSSGRDSPELNQQLTKKELSFDVGDFQPALNIIFSTPIKQKETVIPPENGGLISETELLPEERGVPEGQEDPASMCVSQSGTSRQPLLPGNDGLEDNVEEISFYDLCKVRYLKHNQPTMWDDTEETTKVEDNISLESTVSCATDNCLEVDNSHVENLKVKEDPVAKELALLSANQPEDKQDFRLGNNSLLFLFVEVYEMEDEAFYKMFYGYTRGLQQMVLFLLTNKCAYVLKPGGSECQFVCCNSAKYSDMEYISVILNYQGFCVMCRNKKHFSIYTADEHLTRSILSSLEVAMRRSSPKVPLPGFLTNGIVQIKKLSELLAKELKCMPWQVTIHHFVVVHWEDFDGSNSPAVTPAGPKSEGFLMYRHRHKNNLRNDDTWLPGYFILNGGVLYCMEEENKTMPLFFVQLCVPNCKGCRRLHLPDNPYAFEVILANDDSLQLASAFEDEASHWLHSFMQVISLAGHFIDIDEINAVPCFVVLCNESVVLIQELTTLTCIGKASLHNLSAVFHTSSAVTSLLLEFEIAEASKSCGEWIITFHSELEKEKFLSVLKSRWFSIFKDEPPMSEIKDLSLVQKLQATYEDIVSKKQELKNLCLDT